MSRELWFHPDAETELTEAAEFYARQEPGLDTQFMAEFEHVLRQIVRFPDAATPVHGGLRRRLLPSHPFAVVYRLTDTQIRVLAVAHQKRRPFYWQTRS